MTGLSLKDRKGHAISDWRAWTRPKRDYQWRAGHSAMELARAWFTSPAPVCPPEVAALLESHPQSAGVQLTEGWPEHVTGLPERGEGRNHDLLLIGSRGNAPVVISIEAKVNETFGDTLGKHWEQKRESEKSRAAQRIEALLALVGGRTARPDRDPWKKLRYQLITAIAGTAIEAAKANANTAVFVIHELHTEEADERKLAKNANDLAKLLQAIGMLSDGEPSAGRLYGPLRLAAGKYLDRDVEILMGRAVYDWCASPGAA